ncbi:MAG: hypothetical protein LBM61_08570 [Prevotellaceae bacterium]|jgi:hypothetical protein|nr:hypothetical protein [Prevotellaceae bacterium]
MNKRILLLAFAGLLLLNVASLSAQENLQTTRIFEQYGKRKGATMVSLSDAVLDAYEMKTYKSLTLRDTDEALPAIYRALESDKKQAKIVKENLADGELLSGYYQLPPDASGANRFILFKRTKKGGATLIYIVGELDVTDLISLLFTKE